VSQRLTADEIVDRLTSDLAAAEWEYDNEADELEIVLPGSIGREGRAILVEPDVYLRLDLDTNEPLSITIPVASIWISRLVAELAGHPWAPRLKEPPQSWQGGSHEAVALFLARSARSSGALAAAVA
jgi:hypothetical protein